MRNITDEDLRKAPAVKPRQKFLTETQKASLDYSYRLSHWGKKKIARFEELKEMGFTQASAFDIVENFKGVPQKEDL